MTANQISFARLVEDKRHNQEMERQGVQSISEAVLHNRNMEGINWYTAETGRLDSGIRQQEADTNAETKRIGVIANAKSIGGAAIGGVYALISQGYNPGKYGAGREIID